jgi:hypothetical protein
LNIYVIVNPGTGTYIIKHSDKVCCKPFCNLYPCWTHILQIYKKEGICVLLFPDGNNNLSSLLQTVTIQLGMALGLFAIFGILRFRTVNFTAKDMTYFFVVIGISIINSQANIPPPIIGAIVINSIMIISALLLELFLRKDAFTPVVIVFRKPELLVPEMRKELLKELSEKTGQQIEKIIIRKIDINKGNVELEGYFRDTSGNGTAA